MRNNNFNERNYIGRPQNNRCHALVEKTCNNDCNTCLGTCCCKSHRELVTTIFIDMVVEFNTDGTYSFSELINTSLTKTVMFFVKNVGKKEIIANLQISPNGVDFIDEPAMILPPLNQLKFIVPCIFAKFTRVAVKNVNPLETSTVRLWYQAQE
jgi:hypothetical protein